MSSSLSEMKPEDDLAVAEEHCTKLSHIVSVLKKHNAELRDRVNELELELTALKSEVGTGMFHNRGSFTDLISSVKVLQETLAKKLDGKTVRDLKSGKPLEVMFAKVSTNPSLKLAEGIVDGTGEIPLIPSKSVVIEEV